MVTLAHTFEAGVASGTAISTANSGTGGTAFDAVTTGTGAAAVYSSAAVNRGSLGGAFTSGGTSAASWVSWDTALGAGVTTPKARLVVARVSGSSGLPVLRFRAAGPTQICRITYDGSGAIQIRNSANSVIATSTVVPNTAMCLLRVDVVSHASTGSVTVHIHLDPTVATPDETLSATGAALAGGAATEVGYGMVTGFSSAGVHVDDIVYSDSALPSLPLHVVALSGAVTVADTVARTATKARGAGDAVAAGDAAARALAAARGTADAVAAVDAVARTVSRARATADAVAAGDAMLRATSASRAVADAVSAVGTVARSAVYLRSVADLVGLADAAAGPSGMSAAAADAVAVADTAVRGLTAVRGTGDTVALADTTERLAALVRAVAEQVTVAAVAARGLAAGRAAGDAVGVADAVAGTHAVSANAVDAVTVTDAVSAAEAAAAAPVAYPHRVFATSGSDRVANTTTPGRVFALAAAGQVRGVS